MVVEEAVVEEEKEAELSEFFMDIKNL